MGIHQVPSVHRLDREQWEMMRDGLRKMEPVPAPSGHPDNNFAVRHAKWRQALKSLTTICPDPHR
jgi:hypothetical protein